LRPPFQGLRPVWIYPGKYIVSIIQVGSILVNPLKQTDHDQDQPTTTADLRQQVKTLRLDTHKGACEFSQRRIEPGFGVFLEVVAQP
jgi:hypothetical protein